MNMEDIAEVKLYPSSEISLLGVPSSDSNSYPTAHRSIISIDYHEGIVIATYPSHATWCCSSLFMCE